MGLVLRHTPKGSRGQGREAALVDIAQDLLLRRLSMIGLLDELAFKGGTALRKLYAGNAGRFSSISTSPSPRSEPGLGLCSTSSSPKSKGLLSGRSPTESQQDAAKYIC